MDGKVEQEQDHGPGVGALLRASRLRCGEELRDVAQMLRIRYRHLEAIEEGRFDDLPGPTYAIGFVRAYADHLGLDSQEVVRRFKTDAATIRRSTKLDFPTPVPETGVPGGAIVFIGVFLAVVAYGAWYASTAKEGFFAELISPIPERLAALMPGSNSAPGEDDAAAKDSGGGGSEAPVASATAATTEDAVASSTDAAEGEGASETSTDDVSSSLPSELSEPSRPPTPAEETATAPRSLEDGLPATAAGEPMEAAPPDTSTSPAGRVASNEPAEPSDSSVMETQAVAVEQTSATEMPAPSADDTASGEAPPAAVATPEPEAEQPTSAATTPTETSSDMPTVSATETAQSEPAVAAAPDREAETVVPAEPAPAPVAATPPPTPAAGDSGGTETAPAEPVEVAAVPERETATGADAPPPADRAFGASDESSRILVRAKANSWIQVRDDNGNQLLVTRLLRVGDSYRVPDRPGLKLLTGNAGALEILVDGNTVPSIGPVGAVRRGVVMDVDRLLAGTAVVE